MYGETAMLAPTGPTYDAAASRMVMQMPRDTTVHKEYVRIDPQTGMPLRKVPVPRWRQMLNQFVDRLGQGYEHLPDFLLPWGFFCTVMFPTALLHYTMSLSGLALLLGVVAPAGLFFLSRRLMFKVLSMFCMVASILGFLCGEYGFYAYIYEAGIYARLRWYSNVVPTDSALMYQDAAYLDFSDDSLVDPSRAAGYEWMGEKYCAAPVILTPEVPDPSEPIVSEYWAVGKGCCDFRGTFSCGPVNDRSVHGGIVVLDGSPVREPEKTHYMEAARMASEVSGVLLPQGNDPSFVRWGDDVETFLNHKWNGAVAFVFGFMGILAGSALLLAFIAPWMGVAVAGSSQDKSIFPHPNTAKVMQFGIGHIMKPWHSSHRLDRELVHGRTYWSGEVYHDYIFHVANTHMFVGIIACHPLHPYTKFERFLVCILACGLLLFPTSALEVTLGNRRLIRMVLVVSVVLLPRLCLKGFLEQVTESNIGDSLEDGNAEVRAAARRKLAKEALMFALAFVMLAVVIFGCVSIIHAATNMEVGKVLWMNSYCLGYAFVAEALLDLVRPMHVDAQFTRAQRSQWCLGFFNRWIFERDAAQWNPDYDKEYIVPGL